jgi:hypothetical protein
MTASSNDEYIDDSALRFYTAASCQVLPWPVGHRVHFSERKVQACHLSRRLACSDECVLERARSNEPSVITVDVNSLENV